jgi:16S rRNA (guanine(1405)-N(7))-methyltransferase
MTNPDLQKLVAAVVSQERYRSIFPSLVEKVANLELSKGRSFKETVKATRAKLHQVGSSYQEQGIDYPFWIQKLRDLPNPVDKESLQEFCCSMMEQHASTRERLPFIDSFFSTVLEKIQPIHSIMDVACGLNPLAIPWIPLASNSRYYASDIYSDLIDFLPTFFQRAGVQGDAELCDLTSTIPKDEVQLAFLLKTLPCLEQLDKSIGPRLLEGIRAEHILVSFPVHSLSGRSKGMRANYSAHFQEILSVWKGHVEEFHFSNELVYLLSR